MLAMLNSTKSCHYVYIVVHKCSFGTEIFANGVLSNPFTVVHHA